MIYSIVTYGSPIKLGIDFTGGALLELRFEQPVQPAEVRQVFADNGFLGTTVQTTVDEQTILVRTKPMDPETRSRFWTSCARVMARWRICASSRWDRLWAPR